jgi:hypothetical protein
MDGDLVKPAGSRAGEEEMTGSGWNLSLRNSGTLLTASMLMLIGVLWLATRPYPGIFHDTRFYAVEAISQLHPGRFASDLFFRYGVQGKFSVFTSLFKPFVANLGLASSVIRLTVAGQLLWLGGLLYLASGLLRDRWYGLLAVAAVIALPGTYSDFGYGESFVTPRLFAEALTLAALGLLVRRRAGWALATLAVAAIIHPLMALSGLAFALIYLAAGQKRWWAAILGAALIGAGLAIAGIPPFANLLVTYDPEWFAIVNVRDSFALISRWSAAGYCRTVGTTALAVLALVLAEPSDRRFLGTALAVGIGGIVCTLLGGDLAHNVFIVEIQSWRSMWLLTLVAHLYAVPIVIRLLRQGDAFDMSRLAFATALTSLLVSRFIPPLILVAGPMMAVAAAFAIWQHGTGKLLPVAARLCCLASAGLAWATLFGFAYLFKIAMESSPEEFRLTLYSFALVVAALGLIILPLIAEPQHRQFGRALPWVAAALVLVALLGWDARTPWNRFLESSEPPPASLVALLPQDASVYWERGVEVLWLRLRRPSYFSCTQGAGTLFFRGTAIEFQRLSESFWPLRTLNFGRVILCPKLDDSDKPNRTRDDLREVCRHEPGLDYLVLTRPAEDAEAKIWIAPARFRDVRTVNGKSRVFETDQFYVYGCAALAAG